MKILKIFSFVFLLLIGHSVAFAADPVITSISPSTAKVGDTVTITGTDFPASSLIHFDNKNQTFNNARMSIKPTSITSTSASFVVPFGFSVGSLTVGPGTVKIGPDPAHDTIGTYTYPTSNEVTLNVIDSTPVITSVSPTTVKVGDMVTVTGTGFNYGSVLFASYQVSTLLTKSTMEVGAAMISPTSITFKMPGGIKGPITLKLGGGNYFGTPTTGSNEVAMTVIPIAPTLSSLDPLKARKGTRTTFMVTASNYDIDAVFTIDNNSLYTFPWTRSGCGPGFGDNLTCITIPSNLSTGMHSFQLKETDSGLTSNSLQVEIVDSPILVSVDVPYWNWYKIGGYTPDSVIHLYFNIRGVGFDEKTVAYIDGGSTPVISTECNSIGSCFLNLPNTLVPGSTHTIQVKQSDSGSASNSLSFSIPAKPSTVGTTIPTPTPTPTPTPDCSINNCSTNTPPVCISTQILVNNICKTISTTPPVNGQNTDSYNFGNTTLYRGVNGNGVKELQRFLNTTLNLNLVLDGKFGPKTTAIVKEWQRSHGLKEDGRVGPKTKAMMNSEAK